MLNDLARGGQFAGPLAQLLALAGHAPEQVATAVNGQFVPRSQRASHIVFATDTVVLFRPIVGG